MLSGNSSGLEISRDFKADPQVSADFEIFQNFSRISRDFSGFSPEISKNFIRIKELMRFQWLSKEF